MADCSNFMDGNWAANIGYEILGSTMSSYVGAQVPVAPDLALVQALSGLGKFVLAEGRYNRPGLAAQAIRADAGAVVVGSAITRPEHVTSWFTEDIHAAKSEKEFNQ